MESWYVGVDGCRSGWIAIFITPEGHWKFAISPQLLQVWQSNPNIARLFIDMPMGLQTVDKHPRLCDTEARRKLRGARSHSIFPVPCREAIYAPDYLTACAINEKNMGKKVSKQAWNISQKIRELDQFVRNTPSYYGVLFESHPEVAFWGLNQQQPMIHYKKTQRGKVERISLLSLYFPKTTEIINQIQAQIGPKDAILDDIFDALVLAISALQSQGQLLSLPAQPPIDQHGIPMAIHYTLGVPKKSF